MRRCDDSPDWGSPVIPTAAVEAPALEARGGMAGLLGSLDHTEAILRSATGQTWAERVEDDEQAERAAAELPAGGLVGKAESCLGEGDTEVGRRLRCTTCFRPCQGSDV